MKKELQVICNSLIFSDPARIQTWNLLIRSQILYSVELRGRFEGANIQLYLNTQEFNVIFATKFDKITMMNINDFLPQLPEMLKELPFAITVCDTEGIILYMNDRSISTFQKYGGAGIIGTNLFLYHHGASAVKLRELLDTQTKHAYTIEKNGIRKMIYQSPWFREDKFAGLIELSLEIPMEMPHYVRQ